MCLTWLDRDIPGWFEYGGLEGFKDYLQVVMDGLKEYKRCLDEWAAMNICFD